MLWCFFAGHQKYQKNTLNWPQAFLKSNCLFLQGLPRRFLKLWHVMTIICWSFVVGHQKYQQKHLKLTSGIPQKQLFVSARTAQKVSQTMTCYDNHLLIICCGSSKVSKKNTLNWPQAFLKSNCLFLQGLPRRDPIQNQKHIGCSSFRVWAPDHSKEELDPTCLELLAALDEVDKPCFEPIIKQAQDEIIAEEDTFTDL